MKRILLALYLVLLIYCGYHLISQVLVVFDYNNTFGYHPGQFGRPKTLAWCILVLSYWLLATVALLLLVFRQKSGWTIAIPLSTIGLIKLSYEIGVGSVDIFEYVLAILVIALIILLNMRPVFRDLLIEAKWKYYLASFFVFLIYSICFLMIDQYY